MFPQGTAHRIESRPYAGRHLQGPRPRGRARRAAASGCPPHAPRPKLCCWSRAPSTRSRCISARRHADRLHRRRDRDVAPLAGSVVRPAAALRLRRRPRRAPPPTPRSQGLERTPPTFSYPLARRRPRYAHPSTPPPLSPAAAEQLRKPTRSTAEIIWIFPSRSVRKTTPG